MIIYRILRVLAMLTVMATTGEVSSKESKDFQLTGSVLITHYLQPELDLEVSISSGQEFEILKSEDSSQSIVINPKLDFQSTTLLRAGDPTEMMAYGDLIDNFNYEFSRESNDVVTGTDVDGNTIKLIRNRNKKTIEDLGFEPSDIDPSKQLPDLIYECESTSGEKGRGCLFITPHQSKEITSLHLPVLRGEYSPTSFYHWNLKSQPKFGEPALENVIVLKPAKTIGKFGDITLQAGSRHFFRTEGNPIPSSNFRLAKGQDGGIIGKSKLGDIELYPLKPSDKNTEIDRRSIDRNPVGRYEWKMKNGQSGKGLLKPLPSNPGTISVRAGEPTILTVHGAFDTEKDYNYHWETTHGEIIGPERRKNPNKGQRVNFIPKKDYVGVAVIDFSASLNGQKMGSYQFRIPILPARERVIIKKVTKEDNRLTVQGYIENLDNPTDYKIAVYLHSDVYYAAPPSHIIDLLEGNRFAFSVTTKPAVNRFVVHLIHKDIDPDDSEHCQRITPNGKIVKGQCSGIYDHFYYTKARIPFAINGTDSLAFASYPLLDDNQHHDPQIQYLLNRFCKVPVQFKNDSPADPKAKPDPNAPPNARLIRSYDNHDQMYLYDEALAVLAFVHANEQEAAKKILDALKFLQITKEDDPENPHKDGSWYFSHDPDGKSIYPDSPSWHELEQGNWDRHGYDDRRVTGATAWAAMALNAYKLKYPDDTEYDETLFRVVKYLERIQTEITHNGITSRPVKFQDNDRKTTDWNESKTFSIEHNFDAHSVFRFYAKIKEIENEPDKANYYLARAEEVLRFIKSLWRGENKGFYVGFSSQDGKPNTYEEFMDPQSWSLLTFGPGNDLKGNYSTNLSGLIEKYSSGLNWNYDNFFESSGFISAETFNPHDAEVFKNGGFIGFVDFKTDKWDILETERQYVWTEGTLGMIMAMNLVNETLGTTQTFKKYGKSFTSKDLLSSMNRLQSKDGGVPYATWNAFPTDFSHEPCIAGTTWLYFANHNFNPFAPDFDTKPIFIPPKNEIKTIDQPNQKSISHTKKNLVIELIIDDFNEGIARGKSWERVTSLGIQKEGPLPTEEEKEKGISDKSNTIRKICHGVSSQWPDYAKMSKKPSDLKINGENGQMLKIEYGNEGVGGSAYYTLLGGEDISYFDTLHFWVKGDKGTESFDIGLKDKEMFDTEHRPHNLGSINLFLENGITTEWQEVIVPLTNLENAFHGNFNSKNMGSLAFQFRNKGTGIIYLENISFQRTKPGIIPLKYISKYTVKDGSVFGKRGEFGVFTFMDNQCKDCPKPSIDQNVFYKASSDLSNDPGFRINFENMNIDNESIQIPYEFLEEKAPGDFLGIHLKILGDLSSFKTLVFLIKGKRGGETFQIQLSDKNANDNFDSVRSGSIYRYLPEGVTTEWQVVKIPLQDFKGMDLSKIIALSFDFTEPGSGTFWIDEICFSTEDLVDRKKEVEESDYFLLDDFNHSDLNLLGNKSKSFHRLPSRCEASRVLDSHMLERGKVLQLQYDKRNEGFCGYYTLLKHKVGEYYDLSSFSKVSFSVRGESGDESFEIKMADKKWKDLGNPISVSINEIFPEGITTQWQQATVPLLELGELDLAQMATLVFEFNTIGTGTIYIDNLTFHRKSEEELARERIETKNRAADALKNQPKNQQKKLSVKTTIERKSIDVPKPFKQDPEELGYLLLDNFQKPKTNLFGGPSKTFDDKKFSSCKAIWVADHHPQHGQILKLKFDKQKQGYCGYYSKFNSANEEYFDLSGYDKISFKVKGEAGGESFKICISDKGRENEPPSAGEITKFLENGVTTNWQEVIIPFKKFGILNLSQMSSFSVVFDTIGSGAIYLDDIKIHQKLDEDLPSERNLIQAVDPEKNTNVEHKN